MKKLKKYLILHTQRQIKSYRLRNFLANFQSLLRKKNLLVKPPTYLMVIVSQKNSIIVGCATRKIK